MENKNNRRRNMNFLVLKVFATVAQRAQEHKHLPLLTTEVFVLLF